MIDLLNFYDQCNKDTYFEKFKYKIEREYDTNPFNFTSDLSNMKKIKYVVFDTEEAKAKFREIVQPNVVEQVTVSHSNS